MARCVIEDVVAFRRHQRKWEHCTACACGEQATRHVLRVRGYLPCEILFVGMAPGVSEDALGFPMVGPTKRVIDEWIEKSGVGRLRWGIQNLIACMSRDEEHRTKNRDPYTSEILACRPRLVELVEMAAPGQIVLLGTLAQKMFPRTEFDAQYLHLPHPAFLAHKKVRDPAAITARAVVELRRFAIG